MIINHKILSIPPYLSTSWKNVLSLHVVPSLVDHLTLVVTLVGASRIEIPNLTPTTIEFIFSAHAKFLEGDSSPAHPKIPLTPSQGVRNHGETAPQASSPSESVIAAFGLSTFKLGSGNLDNLTSMLQHSSQQASSPDLPKELLDKIASLSKALGIDDPSLMPKAEPHCNCPHCQIARALNSESLQDKSEEEEEEVVSEEDLKFRIWDVMQTADRVYLVKNPLDIDEQYNVFLGEPIGCTCGEKNCEHIRAVLNS